MSEFFAFVWTEVQAFYKKYPSLSLIMFSLVFTGLGVEPSATSIIEHFIVNPAILGGLWFVAKNGDHFGPIICIFFSVLLTAIMTHENKFTVICQIINLGILCAAWYMAHKEGIKERLTS